MFEIILDHVKKLFNKVIAIIPQAGIAAAEETLFESKTDWENKKYSSALSKLTDVHGFAAKCIDKLASMSKAAISSEIDNCWSDIQEMLNEESSVAEK